MDSKLRALLPEDKLDIDAVARLVTEGYPAIQPLLPDLLTWMQDINWPVAQALQPFLASIGASLAPLVRTILNTNDDVWKYWVVACLVAESRPLILALEPELKKLAYTPTPGEQGERIDRLAENILRRLASGGSESVNPWVNDV
ncbi:MAG: DUF5071 domain-containing protein [Caulobacter sp.]|nr:DUF5071 domain-containing protein [Caulobacter sp.]